MTPRELYLLALDRSADGVWLSDEPPSVALVIHRKGTARGQQYGRRIRIAGFGSPLGEVMSIKDSEDGVGFDINVRVECRKLIDWLDGNGYTAEIRNEL